MLSGLLPDSQISVSSSRDVVWNPGAARLVASRSGWFPAPAQPLTGEEWLQVLTFFLYFSVSLAFVENAVESLQVDLGVPKTVRGVITQGARGGDPGSATENRAFVRKYKVAHSLDGKDWNLIMDSKTSLPKVDERTEYSVEYKI